MLSEDSFGFSDHVKRFHVLVGENIEDFKELTHKRSSSCLLSNEYITLGSQESKDDKPGQPEQEPKSKNM